MLQRRTRLPPPPLCGSQLHAHASQGVLRNQCCLTGILCTVLGHKSHKREDADFGLPGWEQVHVVPVGSLMPAGAPCCRYRGAVIPQYITRMRPCRNEAQMNVSALPAGICLAQT